MSRTKPEFDPDGIMEEPLEEDEEDEDEELDYDPEIRKLLAEF